MVKHILEIAGGILCWWNYIKLTVMLFRNAILFIIKMLRYFFYSEFAAACNMRNITNTSSRSAYYYK